MIYSDNFKNYIAFEEKYYEGFKDAHHFENIGWSLGNACPYKCKHCYSSMVRKSGKNLCKSDIDKIISQINKLPVKTVNLGGNEPWFTCGLEGKSLLPYILTKLHDCDYKIGITTSGITLLNIKKYAPDVLGYINDIDISLDHSVAGLHNKNRGADIYKLAIEALKIAQEASIEHSIIMCAMKWNFTIENLNGMLDLCKKYDANLRFNVLKPLEKNHMNFYLPADQFYEGYQYLLNKCDTIDISEPRLSALVKNEKKVCQCGTSSLRIPSITEDGIVYVSPCIYMHDFKVGDLLEDDILEIVSSRPFVEMRIRNYLSSMIPGCIGCERHPYCRGGCTAQAYLVNFWKTGIRTLNVKETDCWRDLNPDVNIDGFQRFQGDEKQLVHQNYLCTWIGKVREDVK